jgi:hypothetical protein
MKKANISQVSVITKSINANRKKVEAAAVEFQAYWAKAYKKDVTDYLNFLKESITKAKAAAESEDPISRGAAPMEAEVLQSERLQVEVALGKAKQIVLTAEERSALQSLKANGLTFEDISYDYIILNLAGTEWVGKEGAVLRKNGKKAVEAGKPEYTEVTNWTPTTFATYLKRAYNEVHRTKKEAKVSLR